MKLFMSFVLSVVLAVITFAQGIPRDSWPTYNGDFSGKRYSILSKINRAKASCLFREREPTLKRTIA